GPSDRRHPYINELYRRWVPLLGTLALLLSLIGAVLTGKNDGSKRSNLLLIRLWVAHLESQRKLFVRDLAGLDSSCVPSADSHVGDAAIRPIGLPDMVNTRRENRCMLYNVDPPSFPRKERSRHGSDHFQSCEPIREGRPQPSATGSRSRDAGSHRNGGQGCPERYRFQDRGHRPCQHSGYGPGAFRRLL